MINASTGYTVGWQTWILVQLTSQGKNILKYNSLIGLEEPANFFCVRDRTVSMLGYWPEFFNRLRDFSLNTFTGDLTVDSLGYPL